MQWIWSFRAFGVSRIGKGDTACFGIRSKAGIAFFSLAILSIRASSAPMVAGMGAYAYACTAGAAQAWIAMAEGELPTGIVAVTLFSLVSMTLTESPLKFVT
ncbi:hypothetical protein PAESOLCIP111_04566 [Paenibacillus solanacearum]|uniref:Uncharacterized protein n=1 Tax=Paenibacillus solanacearum TaxID=2048548 RepID=A0A916K8D6_9BACL|nr:hypothetical protein PAESOLCIP111_04566 [Paenibacillus solanacearum]